MSEFKPCCPKCGALSVSVHREKGEGWTQTTPKMLVIKCFKCGKELVGQAAEAEIARQQAIKPKAMVVRQPSAGANDAAIRRSMSAQQRAEMTILRAEAATIIAANEHWRAVIAEIRAEHPDHSEAFRCASNLVDIDMAIIERLDRDIQQAPIESLRRLIVELRRVASGLSVRVARAKSVVEEPPPVVVKMPPTPAQVRSDKCAWKDCEKPPGPNSIYCTIDCRHKYARWRHRQRAAALRPG